MTDAADKIDAYIARAQPFARPILKKLRTLFHRASPKLTETLKWGCPAFEFRGLVGIIAGFKHHVSLVLWKAKLLNPPVTNPQKFTALSELPRDSTILSQIRQAIALNERGEKKPPHKSRPVPRTPPDLAAALKKNSRAAATFKSFTPAARRDYLEWILDAKHANTRAKRIAQAVTWMSEGKKRNWKY
jgi:uncharacterized protein YdeI (YjbR/CyaY-like superfamily)